MLHTQLTRLRYIVFLCSFLYLTDSSAQKIVQLGGHANIDMIPATTVVAGYPDMRQVYKTPAEIAAILGTSTHNIYNIDGTLLASRTLEMAGFDLSFNDAGSGNTLFAGGASLSVNDFTNGLGLEMIADDTEGRLETTTNHVLKLGTNLLDAIIIQTDQDVHFTANVGIGSLNPSYPLHVINANPILGYFQNNNADHARIQIASGVGDKDAQVVLGNLDATWYLQLDGDFGNDAFSIFNGGTQTFSINQTTNEITFNTINEDATQVNLLVADGSNVVHRRTVASLASSLDQNLEEVLTVGNNANNLEILNIDRFSMNTSSVSDSDPGFLRWNDQDQTLDIGLSSDVKLQVGQEQLRYIKASAAITNGQAVMLTGSVGASGVQTAAPSNALTNDLSLIGVATESLALNEFGYITTFGKVRDIQTDGANYGETWLVGDEIWDDPTAAGALTNVKPASPNDFIRIGTVSYVHAVNGVLDVHISYGAHLEELHDVVISGLADNDLLAYNSGTTLWENRTAASLSIDDQNLNEVLTEGNDAGNLQIRNVDRIGIGQSFAPSYPLHVIEFTDPIVGYFATNNAINTEVWIDGHEDHKTSLALTNTDATWKVMLDGADFDDDFIIYEGADPTFKIDLATNYARFYNKLGIGGDPTSNVHIIGTGTNQYFEVESTDNFQAGIQFTSGAEDWVIHHDVDFNELRFVHNVGGNTVTFQDDGKVGIGTNAPNKLFHVYDAATSTLARFESGVSNAFIEFKDLTTTVPNPPSIGVSGDDIYFRSVGAISRMTILNNGDIGIGTNTPLSKLHVVGEFRLDNASEDVDRVLRSDANGLASWVDLSTIGGGTDDQNIEEVLIEGSDAGRQGLERLGTTTIEDGNLTLTNLGVITNPRIRIESEDGLQTSFTDISDQNAATVEINKTSTSTSSLIDLNPLLTNTASGYDSEVRIARDVVTDGRVGLSIFRGDGTTTNASFLSTKSDSYLNIDGGNVGIGTNAPVSLMEISKDDETNGATLSITNAAIGSDWNSGDVIGTINFRTDDTSTSELVRGQIKVVDEASSAATYPAYTAMTFSTARENTFAERMRITNDGKVGIGTDSPDEIVEIVDADPILQIRDTDTGIATANATIRLAEAGALGVTDNYWDIGASPVGAELFAFHIDYNGAEHFTIETGAGNAGFGTTDPAQDLVVQDDTGQSAIRINRTAGNWGLLSFATQNSRRFDVGITNGAESGGNAGSDFYINRFDDANAYIDQPLHINRSTGKITWRGEHKFVNSSVGINRVMIDSDGTGNMTFVELSSLTGGTDDQDLNEVLTVGNSAGDQGIMNLTRLEMNHPGGVANMDITWTNDYWYHRFGGNPDALGIRIGDYDNTTIELGRNGHATFNERGSAVDFRIEGDTEPNLFYANGGTDRVGIGTSIPESMLEVEGLGGITVSDNGSYHVSLQNHTGHRLGLFTKKLGTTDQVLRYEIKGNENPTSHYWYNDDTGTDPILTLGDSPLYGLLQLDQDVNNDEGGFAIQNAASSRSMRMWVDTNEGYLSVSDGGVADLVLNEGGGEVGVGMIPIEALSVNGTIGIHDGESAFLSAKAYSGIYESNSSIGSFPFDVISNLVIQARSNSGDTRSISFVTGATPSVRMVVEGLGDVGIGYDDPTQKLQVAGNIYAGDPSDNATRYFRAHYYNGADYQATYQGWGFESDATVVWTRPTASMLDVGIYSMGFNGRNWNSVKSYASAAHSWHNNATTHMTLESDTGDLGIGVTNPLSRLHVTANGNNFRVQEHSVSDVMEVFAIADLSHDVAFYFGDDSDAAQAGFYYDVSLQKFQIRSYNNETAITLYADETVGFTNIPTLSSSDNIVTYGAGGLLEQRTIVSIGDEIALANDQNLSEVLAIGNDAGAQSIVNADNVGIRTASPNYALDVDAANIKPTDNLILGENAYSASSNFVGLETLNMTDGQEYMIIAEKTTGATYVSSGVGQALTLRAGANDNSNSVTLENSVVTYRADRHYFINGGVNNGYVGINEASPVARLDVSGLAHRAAHFEQTTGGGPNEFGSDTDNFLGTGSDDSYKLHMVLRGYTPNVVFEDISGSTDPFYITVNSNEMYFGQVDEGTGDATTLLKINASNDVGTAEYLGAGTFVPEVQLHVRGTELTDPNSGSYGLALLEAGAYTNGDVYALDFGSSSYAYPMGRISLEATNTHANMHFSLPLSSYAADDMYTAMIIKSSNGFVGIGNLDPQKHLDILGTDAEATSIINSYSTTGVGYAAYTEYKRSISSGATTNLYRIGAKTDGTFEFKAGTEAIWSANTTDDYFTVNNQLKMATNTDAGVTGNIRWTGTDFEGKVGGVWTSFTGAGGSLFTDGGLTTYLTSTTDNLALGHTTASARLDIDAGSNSTGLRIRGLAETTQIGDIFVDAVGSLKLSTLGGNNDGAGHISILTESTSYGLIVSESDGSGTSIFGNIYVKDGGSVGQDLDDYLTITVNSTEDADAFVVTGQDRVGIGTSTPNVKLMVEDATATALGLVKIVQTSTGDATLLYSAGGTIWNAGIDNTDGDKFKFSDDAGTGDVGVGTVMTLQPDGNVGIGTASPTVPLHIATYGNANMLVESYYTGSGNYSAIELNNSNTDALYPSLGRIMFTTDYAGTRGGVYYQHDQTGANERLYFSVAGGSHLNILGTGDVGIGIEAPTRRLHVYEATTDFVAKFYSNDDKAGIEIQDDVDYSTILVKGGYLSMGGTADLSVNNLNVNLTDGDVGINTISPQASLHVAKPSSGSTVLIGRASGESSIESDGVDDWMIIDGGDGIGNVSLNRYATGYVELGYAGGEVNVNNNSTSTGDFRVESNTETHMLFVDAGENDVKIGTSAEFGDAVLSVDGKIISDTYIEAGYGGGSVGLTVNDGQGNASLVFNHMAGIPAQASNFGRIEVNVDADGTPDPARMNFSLLTNAVSGGALNGVDILTLEHLSGTDGKVAINDNTPQHSFSVSNGGVVDFKVEAGSDIFHHPNGGGETIFGSTGERITFTESVGYNVITFDGGSLRFNDETNDVLYLSGTTEDVTWSARSLGVLHHNSTSTSSATFAVLDFNQEINDVGDIIPDITGNDITIGATNGAGYYEITVQFIGWLSGGATSGTVTVFKGATELSDGAQDLFTEIVVSTTDVTTYQSSAIISLSSSDVLTVRGLTDGTLNLDNLRFTVKKEIGF